MTETKIFYYGDDDYCENTHIIDHDTKQHKHILRVREDVPLPENRTIDEIFLSIFERRKSKKVEILYSGGVDSEWALFMCMKNQIPVEAVTMRMKYKGIVFNTHDLYYSAKFCNEHNIKQKIVDLEFNTFMENGEFTKYLDPYLIVQPHVATHFWLIEQCDSFPVMGGQYIWPWHNLDGARLFSPVRYEYSQWDRFLKDNSIDGIGDFQKVSLELNMLLGKKLVDVAQRYQDPTSSEFIKMLHLKSNVYSELGFPEIEPRCVSYGGYEKEIKLVYDIFKHREELVKRYGDTESVIVWGEKMASINNGSPGSNTLFK